MFETLHAWWQLWICRISSGVTQFLRRDPPVLCLATGIWGSGRGNRAGERVIVYFTHKYTNFRLIHLFSAPWLPLSFSEPFSPQAQNLFDSCSEGINLMSEVFEEDFLGLTDSCADFQTILWIPDLCLTVFLYNQVSQFGFSSFLEEIRFNFPYSPNSSAFHPTKPVAISYPLLSSLLFLPVLLDLCILNIITIILIGIQERMEVIHPFNLSYGIINPHLYFKSCDSSTLFSLILYETYFFEDSFGRNMSWIESSHSFL